MSTNNSKDGVNPVAASFAGLAVEIATSGQLGGVSDAEAAYLHFTASNLFEADLAADSATDWVTLTE